MKTERDKIIGVNLKTLSIAFGSLLTILLLWTAIDIRCNMLTVQAKEAIIRPEAILVFKEYHKPFESKLDSLFDLTKVLVEISKLNDPTAYSKAKDNLKNKPGSFPVEGEE
jgi:hypothetical protein